MNRRLLISSTLAATITIAATAVAQEGPVTFEFSFSNPGARALGLGGAFAALADDATAAFANPSGLVQLLEPEVSVEGRLWSYDIPYVAGGRAAGEPTGIGVDTTDGLRWGTSSNDITDLSYLSFVYPWQRWSLAVYRHRWADFDFAREVNGLFGLVDGELDRSEDVLERSQLQVVNNGLAAAFEISEKLSLGLGLVYYQAELTSLSQEFGIDDEDFFSANSYEPELLDTIYSRCAKDSGVTVHLGALWRPSARWSIGGYYREGPEMTLAVTEVTGPAEEDVPPGTIERDDTTTLHLPDVYGIGVAYRSSNGAWTLSFEWDRVLYSRIGDDLDGGIFDVGEVALEDGDELRLGAEYVFVNSKPVIAVRLGAWHDPAHGVATSYDADLFERTIFQGGADQMHFTAGVGVVFRSFQLDLGIDLADTVHTASLSIVYRF